MAAVLEETQQEPPEVIECWKAREAPLMLMVCRYLMQLNVSDKQVYMSVY
jgi:hypothetical protein